MSSWWNGNIKPGGISVIKDIVIAGVRFDKSKKSWRMGSRPGSPFGLEDEAPWTSWMLNFWRIYRLDTYTKLEVWTQYGLLLSLVATSLLSRKCSQMGTAAVHLIFPACVLVNGMLPMECSFLETQSIPKMEHDCPVSNENNVLSRWEQAVFSMEHSMHSPVMCYETPTPHTTSKIVHIH